MTQNWEKKGLIFSPNGTDYWQKSHAALPTSILLKDNIFRTFFTSRDSDNKTYVGYFDWNIEDYKNILAISTEPVLSPGNYGFFDDHGVQVTNIVRFDNKLYMYYLGWNPSKTVPVFYTAIGLAISEDNGKTFKKTSNAPIMERSVYDPWMVSGGTVIIENNIWRMWYISGIAMEINEGKTTSYYDIKYAESNDGISWKREGIVSFPLQKDETNISRVSILKEGGIYKAWFPVKKQNQHYRIGYAESNDGISWKRLDEYVGIDVSASGWDSQALDKLEVIKYNNKKIMLYNGNNFGKEGIGLAVLPNNLR